MDKAVTNIIRLENILDSFNLAEEVAEVPSMTLLLKVYMMVSGVRTKNMALEKSSIMKRVTMKVTGYEARRKAMDCLSFKTRLSTQDNGRTTWLMEKAH